MSKQIKIILGILLAGFVLVGLFVVDQFVYPFTASPPYFSDVEKVFDRIQIPADWKETARFDNSGIAGKRCPIEPGSVCFLKSKTFQVPLGITTDAVKDVFKSSGCPVVGLVDNSSVNGDREYRLECSIEGLSVGGDFFQSKGEVYVSVDTP